MSARFAAFGFLGAALASIIGVVCVFAVSESIISNSEISPERFHISARELDLLMISAIALIIGAAASVAAAIALASRPRERSSDLRVER